MTFWSLKKSIKHYTSIHFFGLTILHFGHPPALHIALDAHTVVFLTFFESITYSLALFQPFLLLITPFGINNVDSSPIISVKSI